MLDVPAWLLMAVDARNGNRDRIQDDPSHGNTQAETQLAGEKLLGQAFLAFSTRCLAFLPEVKDGLQGDRC